MVLYATAKKTGVTSFEVKKVELATRDGLDIAVEGVDGQITIESQAPILTATAIPVIDPTEIIIVPTFSPPTATPVRTATPKPTQTKATTVTNAPTRTATLAPTETRNPAATQITQPTSAAVSEVGGTPTAEPTLAEIVNTLPAPTEVATIEGRELAKGSALSLGKLLPWLISAIVLLIIAGVILFIRRKHVDQTDQIDHSGGDNEK